VLCRYLTLPSTANPHVDRLWEAGPGSADDSSTLGIGSHLWQLDDDGIPHTCAYLSVATMASQVKWASQQLELFGLAMSLRAHESLLLHQTIDVYMDNAMVMQLSKYRPTNAREKRLVAYLSQFRLNIKYVKGTRNRVADYLSRLPEDLSTEQVQKLRPSHNLMNEEFILSLSSNSKTQAPMLSNGRDVQKHLGSRGLRGRLTVAFQQLGATAMIRCHMTVLLTPSGRRVQRSQPRGNGPFIFSIQAMLLKDRVWQSRCRSQEVKLAN